MECSGNPSASFDGKENDTCEESIESVYLTLQTD